MLKIIKDSTLVPTPIVDLKLDSEPRQGSTNPVTSEGVKTAIEGAVGDASEALQQQIDDIAEKAGSGYIPKGEATVATLNGLSGQENGDLYTMTDAGTLTDGSVSVVAGDTVAWDATNSVWYKAMDYAPRQYGTNEVHNLPTSITAFRTGDVIPVDGPSGTAKMSKDDLLRVTADNALADVGQVRFYQGLINANGDITDSYHSIRCRTDLYDCSMYQSGMLSIGMASGLYYRVIFFSDYAISSSNLIDTDSNTNWQQTPKKIKIPSNAKGFALCIRKSDESDITPSDCVSLSFELVVIDNSTRTQEDLRPFAQSTINIYGWNEASTTRCRTGFRYTNGASSLSIQQTKSQKARVVFYSSNVLGDSNLVDTTSNKNWTSGNFVVDVPSTACFFIVVTANNDDSSIVPRDVTTQLSYDDFGKKDYINFVPLTTGYFSASSSRVTSKCNIVDKSKDFVNVKISNGFKYRVVFYETKRTFNTQYIKTDTSNAWQTKSMATPIPYNAECFYIAVAKTDDSDISSNDVTIDYFMSNNSEFGKVISILGDSISTFGGSVSDPNNARYAGVDDPTYTGNRCRYPQTDLLTDVNDTYWMRLIHDLGLELGINESWAGSRVSNTSATDTGDVGPNRCISSMTRIGHLDDNGTPDIILVNAGTNDIGNSVAIGTFNYDDPSNYTDAQIASLDVSTFAGAYRAMLIRLQKTYPSARIIVMLPNYTTSYYNPQKEDQYCEIVKEACDYFGVPYIDMRTAGITMFNRSSYLSDGIHYNASGMKLIYEKVLLGFEANL